MTTTGKGGTAGAALDWQRPTTMHQGLLLARAEKNMQASPAATCWEGRRRCRWRTCPAPAPAAAEAAAAPTDTHDTHTQTGSVQTPRAHAVVVHGVGPDLPGPCAPPPPLLDGGDAAEEGVHRRGCQQLPVRHRLVRCPARIWHQQRGSVHGADPHSVLGCTAG
jgi:hypothetical protein